MLYLNCWNDQLKQRATLHILALRDVDSQEGTCEGKPQACCDKSGSYNTEKNINSNGIHEKRSERSLSFGLFGIWV